MDRTVATGTGYIGQYSPEVAKLYETLTRCPDNLVLFMHHVPYTYQLHSGKTLIQEVYDSHYWGAAQVQTFIDRWKQLQGIIDSDRYQSVLEHLQYQAGHAIVWRDAINNWFQKESGIADKSGRVGNDPNRIEAESLHLDAYQIIPIEPWEDASNEHAISCPEGVPTCSATLDFNRPAGWYRINIQYFDTTPGVAHLTVFVGDQPITEWKSDANLPWKIPNGDTSTRKYVGTVALRPGDKIRIVGTPDDSDRAAIDYIEIIKATNN